MKIFFTNCFDPYENVATEELLLKDKTINEDIIFIWQNKNTIVFGRNQNIHQEINEEFVKKNNISLVRRLSGGGAVYHDDGNVNFTFITSKHDNSYTKFLNPIIEFLISIGIDAKFKGKNDLEVKGFKISGNAQYIYKNKILHHGTLLYNTNLIILSKALKPNKLKMESKGISSIISRVKNISELINFKMSSLEFKNALINFFAKKYNVSPQEILSYKTFEKEQLINIKKSYDWNFGKNPEFNILNEKHFEFGTVKILLNVINNKISSILIEGDFLSSNDFENFYKYFINQKFTSENIKKIINEIENWEEYFGKITKEEITLLMLAYSQCI